MIRFDYISTLSVVLKDLQEVVKKKDTKYLLDVVFTAEDSQPSLVLMSV